MATTKIGLVTSETGTFEIQGRAQAAHRARNEEATNFTDLDRLCLSPQCGFASTEEGNILAEHEQWAKLRLIVEIVEEIWG
jgi:5-methyltetrahydropteroyltriglutamate--homocysteine methyltransferase